MKTYRINVIRTMTYNIEREAENRDAAVALVDKMEGSREIERIIESLTPGYDGYEINIIEE